MIHNEVPPKTDASARPAPSLSPDILVSFLNDPFQPYFGDFVASSPSMRNKCRHGEAAQLAHVSKLQHYFKHHVYPSRVCYPLAFERSGHLHPTFSEFIELYASSCSPSPTPHVKLQLIFSVAFAITFTTASLLKAASRTLLPYSTQALFAPHALPIPARWAPQLPLPRTKSRTSAAAIATLCTTPSVSDLSQPNCLNSSSTRAGSAQLGPDSSLLAARPSECLGNRLNSGRPAVTFSVTAVPMSDV